MAEQQTRKYIVVMAERLSLLEQIVCEAIDDGYIPVGGIAVQKAASYQAMVLKDLATVNVYNMDNHFCHCKQTGEEND